MHGMSAEQEIWLTGLCGIPCGGLPLVGQYQLNLRLPLQEQSFFFSPRDNGGHWLLVRDSKLLSLLLAAVWPHMVENYFIWRESSIPPFVTFEVEVSQLYITKCL